MQLIDDLRAEHDLIEQVVGSFRAFVDQRSRSEGDAADGPLFIRFFRLFAGDFHHAKEEDTLFPALREKADLPERGPIAVLTADHRRLAALLDEMTGLLERDSSSDRERLRALAIDYSHGLWHHIDAENSVLLPESEGRLQKKGVTELPSRPMTPGERAARADGEDLVRRYPPSPDPTIVRGDGCVSCHAFAESCRGLEREWWNEWEWEEFEEHLAGD
ncbi:MAG TPA: hemerythrin domain-containing protein [Vicinamibacterales bacterium]|nr:hemerythrin domain-containing protein [Vicinamibacterales bacterium]